MHCVIRQNFLEKGGAQCGDTGLDEAVGTIFVFLVPYLSTTLKLPLSILAVHDPNVRPTP